MAMFDWLKGKDKKVEGFRAPDTSNRAPDTQPEVPTFKPHRLEGELPIPERNEAHEAPRVAKFEQVRYGKLVQQKDGPIIRGFEHDLTAKSPGLPRNLEDCTHIPEFEKGFNVVMAGDSKFTPDSMISKTTVMGEDGRPYILCTRIGYPSKGGTEKADRRYTEAHAMAIPAEEWTIAAVPMLYRKLKPEGQTERNSNLPQIEINTKGLDTNKVKINSILMAGDVFIPSLLTGRGISIDDKTLGMGQSPDLLIFMILATLPQSVARELSFSLGLNTPKNGKSVGSARISQGTHISADRSVYNGEWWQEGKKDTHSDLSLGKEYMTELKLRLPPPDTMITYRDLLKAVDTMPHDLVKRVRQALFGKE